jgi:hypothetical protein
MWFLAAAARCACLRIPGGSAGAYREGLQQLHMVTADAVKASNIHSQTWHTTAVCLTWHMMHMEKQVHALACLLVHSNYSVLSTAPRQLLLTKHISPDLLQLPCAKFKLL